VNNGGIDHKNCGSFCQLSAFELRDFQMEREISQNSNGAGQQRGAGPAQAQFMGMWPRLSTSLQLMLPS
jgi:hypothetical protein